MRRRFARLASGAVVLGLTAVAATKAEARDPAPIVYVSQPAPNTLAGGADTSYGYGRNAAAATQQGAMIDLRGASTRNAQQSAQAEQGRGQDRSAPDWLERERVGPPYQANGRWYAPTPEPGFSETGAASWY